ncbi:phosphohydrolase [Desulforamulus ferrireducens]|uniref:Phosphohydrolase n=2 Tax=Desulforamulus ferrireducens TaxID=1833852 RepID=A0A1S6IUD5_9FIRM|nr:phosphohydrolase [Desulforamulus ferrireducens]
MNDWHNNRDEDYRNLYINLYTYCIIVLTIAVIFKFNWDYVKVPPKDLLIIYQQMIPILIFLLASLLGCFLIIRFKAMLPSILVLVVFVFIFIIIYHDIYLKTLLIIPVALASFFRNKTFGLIVSLGCGVLLIVTDLYLYGSDYNKYIESDIIFTGVMFIFAWLTGGIASIEKTTRNVLLDMANRDGLSGVYNHRYFQVYLKTSLEEAKKNNGSLSLIIFDLDYFKYYNDTFGHIAGDQILKDVGQVLSEEIASPAIAARYGGDEFCILLPGYNTAAVYSTAKKLKSKIESFALNNAKELPTGKMTVSIGVANYPEHTKSGEDLLELADHALYKAKKTSKNKIELYFNVLDSLKTTCTQSETELLSSIKTLLSIINAKDRYTYGHSERVLEYATLLAKNCSLSEEEVRFIQYGAYLHDIGKIEVDIDILNSTNKLTESEWDILKQHPYWGSEIIRPIKSLDKVAPFILHHHENYDGTGYPLGISGEAIPLGARIIRIADSFDAMVTDRPYKKGMSPQEACNELMALAGTHYDPELCTVFVKQIESQAANTL